MHKGGIKVNREPEINWKADGAEEEEVEVEERMGRELSNIGRGFRRINNGVHKVDICMYIYIYYYKMHSRLISLR